MWFGLVGIASLGAGAGWCLSRDSRPGGLSRYPWENVTDTRRTGFYPATLVFVLVGFALVLATVDPSLYAVVLFPAIALLALEGRFGSTAE